MSKKPGKYDHVLGSLPRLTGAPGALPGYQDKVEATKEAILAPQDGEALDPRPTLKYELLKEADSSVLALNRILLRECAGQRHATKLAATYAELRALKDKLAEWESNVNLLLEAYAQLMVDQMENEGVSGLRLASGRGVTTFLEPYVNVADTEAFRLWCVEQGLAAKMTLHPSTTAALVKELLVNGEEVPPGVNVFAKTKIRLGSE